MRTLWKSKAGSNATKVGGLRRRLTLRIASLLSLFLLLVVGSFWTTNSAIETKESDSATIIGAGWQRMLLERYSRQIDQAIAGKARGDGEAATAQRQLAAQTADDFLAAHRTFLHGGELHLSSGTVTRVPPIQDDNIRSALGRVETAWNGLQRIGETGLRSEIPPLQKADLLDRLQAQTQTTATLMEDAARLMLVESGRDLKRLHSLQRGFLAAALILFALVIWSVHKNIAAPMESAFRERERLRQELELILDTVGKGICGIDSDGKVYFANSHAAQVLGRKVSDMKGCALHDLLHGGRCEDQQHGSGPCAFERSRTDSRHFVDQDVFVRADGTTFDVEYSSTPIKRADKIVGRVVVFRDITQRKEVEQRLQTLNRAVEQSPSTVVITDQDGKIEYVNPKFTELTGYAPGDVMGRNPRFLKSGNMNREVYKDLWRTIKAGREWHGELLNRRKNGDLFWESASISPLTNSLGETTHYVAVKEDITERRLSEQRLHNYAQQQQTLGRILSTGLEDRPLNELLDQALEIILSLSWLNNVQRGGIFLADTTGQDLETRAHRNLNHHEDRPCSCDALDQCCCKTPASIARQVFADCQESRYDVRYENAKSLGHYCVPIPGKERTLGVLWIGLPPKHECSESEVQLLESVAQTLAGIIQRKQAERERGNLAKQLAESSRACGMAEVATGVLHNVGNVLNSVNVSASVLTEKLRTSRVEVLARASEVISDHKSDLGAFLCTDKQGEHFPRLLEELTAKLCEERDSQMAELRLLIENIEHIKEIVSMQQTLAPMHATTELVDPIGLIEDALKINDSGLMRHSVKVQRHFPETRPIITERHKVLQILVNLISNAKYALTDSDQVNKTITLTVSADAESVRIQVRDNGVGIPHENQTKIFSYGFTTRNDGHGFGLHSSALAAQELGASLSVHSDGPGTGATFTLRHPITKEVTCTD